MGCSLSVTKNPKVLRPQMVPPATFNSRDIDTFSHLKPEGDSKPTVQVKDALNESKILTHISDYSQKTPSEVLGHLGLDTSIVKKKHMQTLELEKELYEVELERNRLELSIQELSANISKGIQRIQSVQNAIKNDQLQSGPFWVLFKNLVKNGETKILVSELKDKLKASFAAKDVDFILHQVNPDEKNRELTIDEVTEGMNRIFTSRDELSKILNDDIELGDEKITFSPKEDHEDIEEWYKRTLQETLDKMQDKITICSNVIAIKKKQSNELTNIEKILRRQERLIKNAGQMLDGLLKQKIDEIKQTSKLGKQLLELETLQRTLQLEEKNLEKVNSRKLQELAKYRRGQYIESEHKKFIWTNGFEYEGGYKNGMKHEYGKYIYPTGRVYIGEFKFNKFHGYGLTYYADREIHEGGWKDDKKDGPGTYYYENGDRYEGEWRNDERNGLGTYYFANGKKVESGLCPECSKPLQSLQNATAYYKQHTNSPTIYCKCKECSAKYCVKTLHCYNCNYDICESCLCPRCSIPLHWLKDATAYYKQRAYSLTTSCKCNGCSEKNCVKTRHCYNCDYDICDSCVETRSKKQQDFQETEFKATHVMRSEVSCKEDESNEESETNQVREPKDNREPGILHNTFL